MRVLEPSAGMGALIDALPFVVDVVAVEINLGLAQRLRNLHPGISVIQADFLNVGMGLGEFDRVIMNPPFDRGLDIKHILHARELLATGGRLVAVCADGSRQREAFEPIAELYDSLPADAFEAQGTGVRTALVVLESPS
jgi:predicted RNA methylase